MATKKVEKKGCACDLDKAVADFKKRQDADAMEEMEAPLSQKNYNYAILVAVLVNIVLSLVTLYVLSNCGASCHGKP